MPAARVVLYVLLVASLGLSARALWSDPPPLWSAGLLLGLLLVVLVIGAMTPSLQMYGNVLYRLPEARGCVALTFDDGPDPTFTGELLDRLAERDARATFFVLGSRALAHPELIARMLAQGHTVGMHSMDHYRGFAFLTPRAVATDVESCRAAIACAIGSTPRPELLWFRPPVGQASPRTFAGLRRSGAEMVGWSLRARDGLRGTTVGEVLARLRSGLREGDIVLLHDAWERPHPNDRDPPAGARAITDILDLCAERGLQPVSLDELVARAS